MKPSHAIIIVVSVLAGAIPLAHAQSIASNGTPTFGSFSGGPDVINNANLNIHYTVPVFARAGIGMPFSYSLSVDNGVWYTYQDVYQNWHWGADFSTAQPVGIMAVGAIFYTTSSYLCVYRGFNFPITKYTVSSYTGLDNTSHPISGAWMYFPSCPNGYYTNSPTGLSSDNSGITVNMTSYSNGTVTLRNGTVITPPWIGPSGKVGGGGTFTIKDTNNNEISVYAPNPPQISYILDTLGTQPITSSGGPPPTTVKYSYTAPSGAQANVTMTYKQVTIQSAWGCSKIPEYPPTGANLVDKITLPDGTFYEFFYEPTTTGSGNTTGRISEVSLPTGGTISYNYTGGDTGKGISCVDGSTEGFNRVSSQSGTVQYSSTPTFNQYNQLISSITQITDNSANATTVNFSSPAYGSELYEVQRSVYQGRATGTPLENVITCYGLTGQLTASTCQSGSFAGLSRTTAFRSLNGGPYSETDVFYNNYGLVTKQDAYDWGASTYTQEGQTTYDTALGDGIINRPSTVQVVDGAGNLKSKTTYSYDDFAISGDTKTCAPAIKCRGNLTKLTKYASSSTTFTTQMTYNLNGTVATSLDPNGTTSTTLTYGSGGCGAFPSQTQVKFGSTTLTTSATYNCTGTVLTSNTDANGKITSASYTDPYFWRPYSSTDQLNNATTYSYTGQTIAESAMTFNGSQSTVDVRTTLDSFGRPEYKQKRQGVGSSYFDSTQQVYDSSGRPNETSMPYQGTAGQAPGSGIYTQASYDAMMRTTSVQDAAGGTVNTSYSQNDVYQQIAPAPTGENTKQKQLEYDGLGRLTSVCEITHDTKYGGACGQVTGSYSGYLTKYVYDTPPNVNSLTVTQNGQPNGGTSQTRTYYYDMLGRLNYESNPETGVNQYFYDSLTGDANCGTVSSPGDLVKTIDNKGVVACLSYDGLHRVTSISYSATTPPTPTKVFVYESAVVNGITMGLTAGRLAEAYTCTTCSPTPTKLTDIGFTYSARGELTDVYESTPHSGGYYHVNAGYWAHGLLSSLTLAGTSLPTIYYGGSTGSGLDGEGRVTTVTASSGTATLASNVIYTTSGTTQPIGSLTSVTLGSGDSDAFGYDTKTGRLTGYTFNMNSKVAKNGALTWNANGSLGTLTLTDSVTPANTQTCSYSHDDLARIASASCKNGSTTLWSQTFAFDPFGNIDKTATVGGTFLPTYNLATNQYSSIPGCTPSYDGDGNLTNDCSHSYNWFADGGVASVDTVSLTYDALGRAVEQARGSSYTEIVYTPGGGKLALMNSATIQKAFIPLPGGETAVYTTGSSVAYYRHAEWLGSSRLASTPSAPTTVYADAEYAPYGESYVVTGTLDLNFTGQNQDTVPSQNGGVYDFLFREYNPQHGRWISPDSAGMSAVSLGSPQTWNRYSYVANRPFNTTDALGLFSVDASDCTNGCRTGGFTYSDLSLLSYSVEEDVFTFAYFKMDPGLDFGIIDYYPHAGAQDLISGTETSEQNKAANNTTNCSHGFGIGLQGGGTMAAGLKSGGVVTGQLGGGAFVNSSGPSVGGYASGALAGRWGSSTGGYPSQSLQAPWVGGAYAGYGPGIFITNAGSPAQLGGPFAVLFNVDIGIGIGKASIQFAADKNGTFILTVNGGPVPYADGLGFDVSGFTSKTKAVGTGCKP